MKGAFFTELEEIEQMFIRSDFHNALKQLDKLLKRKELLDEEIIQAKILKARVYLDIQPFSKALSNAKQAYEASVRINNILLIIDSAHVYSRSLGYLGYGELSEEKRKHANKLLENYKDKESHDFLKRKALTLFSSSSRISEVYIDKLNQAIEIYELLGDDYGRAWALFSKATFFSSQGIYSESERYYDQSLKIFTKLGNIVGIIACTVNTSANYLQRGELDDYLRGSLKALSYAEEIDSSYCLGGIYGDLGFYYWQKGDLETSLQYYNKSIEQIKRGKLFGHIHYIAIHFRMNLVYLEQQKFEKVQQNLEKMEIVSSLISLQDTSFIFPYMYIYKLAQSIYLKDSSFEDQQEEIERILKEVAQEKKMYIEMNRLALFHLCDFYLRKLKLTNDLELLDPLNQTIEMLEELAEKQKSSSLLAETYLIKSHLAQLELKLEDAKILLEKAQKIADEKGITRLATLISNEYDYLLDQVSSWESFTAKLPNIADRLELTHLEDMMDKLSKNKISFADVSHENEDPSLFLILDKNGHVVFSDNFEGFPLDDRTSQGIISTIHDFLDENELEEDVLQRLRSHTYSFVLYRSKDLILSYVFVGKSYSAMQKINTLIHDFDTFSELWNEIKSKIKSKQELSLEDRSNLSNYLEKVFL